MPRRRKGLGESLLSSIDTDGLLWRVKAPKPYSKAPRLNPYQLQALYDAQNGRCANIGCNITLPLNGQGRAIDHCHQTGSIRGLLCGNCNKGLGFLHDDPRRIIGLLDYLGYIDLPGFHKHDRLIAQVMEGTFAQPAKARKLRKIKVKDPQEPVKLLVDLDPPTKDA